MRRAACRRADPSACWRFSARGCSRRWSRFAPSKARRMSASRTSSRVLVSRVARSTSCSTIAKSASSAAFDEGISRASRYALESYDPTAGWAERIRTALTGLLSFLDAERGMGQLIVVGSLGAGHKALLRRRRGIAQIIAVVDEGRMERESGSELPPLTAEGIVGGVLSVLARTTLGWQAGTAGGAEQVRS